MSCLKCGSETEQDQVFCPNCLREMEKYPVKPNTVIQLPQRRAAAAGKKPTGRRRKLTPEEREARLKRRIRSLRILLFAMVVLAAALIGAVIRLVNENVKPLPGQNYSIATTAAQESVE